MKSYIENTKKYFSDIRLKGDTISLKDIRMSKFIYFAAYALELMLFNARNMSFQIGIDVGNVSGWTIAQIFHGIASLVFMLLWKENFKGLVKTSVIIMVASFVPYLFLPVGYVRFVFGIIFYIGLGGAVTSARCGYAFALNNAERFIGMLVMFFTVTVFKYLNSIDADGIIVKYIIPLGLLAGLSICLLKFKPEDFVVKEKSDKRDKTGIYWALAFFILYFSIDGYRACLVSTGSEDYKMMCAGMLVAGILLLVSVSLFKFSSWHIWNLFFIVSVAMAIFAGFKGKLSTEAPIYFCGGLTFIGWPLCIYTLGCAQRRFASYSLMKKCTFIFVLAAPITTMSSDIMYVVFSEYFHIIAMVYIILAVIVFSMLSPYSFQRLFSVDWIKEIRKTDMKLLEEKVDKKDRFDDFNLTPRQKEIAVLILSAKTRRQIAGELGISESTVKMHTSDLYKKLGINSKTELFVLFGVTQEEEI